MSTSELMRKLRLLDSWGYSLSNMKTTVSTIFGGKFKKNHILYFRKKVNIIYFIFVMSGSWTQVTHAAKWLTVYLEYFLSAIVFEFLYSTFIGFQDTHLLEKNQPLLSDIVTLIWAFS